MSLPAAPVALGQTVPDFGEVPGADGMRYSFASFPGARAIALVFVCTGCPTVRAFEPRLRNLQDTKAGAGLRVLLINSNNSYLSPTDTLDEMASRARAASYNFPYVKDEKRSVARLLGAICTPHAFLLDSAHRLVYRGRIEDARDPVRVTRRDLEAAVEDVLADRAVRQPETEPYGCSIIW